MEYKYTSIILQKKDVGETDRIYTFYTLEQGKIQALAKGIRKPQAKLAGHLENFFLTGMTVMRTHGMGKVTSSVVEKHFPSLRREYSALAVTFEVLDKFNKLIQLEHRDDQVFALLLEYLETVDSLTLLHRSMGVDEYDQRIQLLGGLFLFKLLDNLGYASETGACCGCGVAMTPQTGLHFSAEHGGVVCSGCARVMRRVIPLSVDAAKLLRISKQHKIPTLAKIRARKKEIDTLRLITGEVIGWVS